MSPRLRVWAEDKWAEGSGDHVLPASGIRQGWRPEGGSLKAPRGDAWQGATTTGMKGSEQKPSLIPGPAGGFQDSQALQGSLWGKQGQSYNSWLRMQNKCEGNARPTDKTADKTGRGMVKGLTKMVLNVRKSGEAEVPTPRSSFKKAAVLSTIKDYFKKEKESSISRWLFSWTNPASADLLVSTVWKLITRPRAI